MAALGHTQDKPFLQWNNLHERLVIWTLTHEIQNSCPHLMRYEMCQLTTINAHDVPRAVNLINFK